MRNHKSHKLPTTIFAWAPPEEAAVLTRDPLDVHCQLDDGFALCGGNKVPRIPHDRFVQLGEVLTNAPPSRPRRWPWQRCGACVAMLEGGAC